MNVELIALTRYLRDDGSPEVLIEYAGRVCYRSAGHGDPGGFIRARLRDGHESILEHASATFEISGISRACSHQLVRHRIASYSQESQRYVDADDLAVVMPAAIAENPAARAAWEGLMAEVAATYRELRELGVRKEDARFVLPNAAETRLVLTMNFRSLRHFFRLRLTPRAQWEIRELATRMLELLVPHAPHVFGDVWDAAREEFPEFLAQQ